jgi:hypothetical protein
VAASAQLSVILKSGRSETDPFSRATTVEVSRSEPVTGVIVNPPGLQFGLQFIAVRPGSAESAHQVRPAARTAMNPYELAPLKLLIRGSTRMLSERARGGCYAVGCSVQGPLVGHEPGSSSGTYWSRWCRFGIDAATKCPGALGSSDTSDGQRATTSPVSGS